MPDSGSTSPAQRQSRHRKSHSHQMRFRLRTLMIVLALGPLTGACGYWTWDALRPKPPPWSPWYIDGPKDLVPPPGFKLSAEAAAMKAYRADLEAENQRPTDNDP